MFPKVLAELVKDITSKLHKSEFEQKQLAEKVLEMEESVKHVDTLEKVCVFSEHVDILEKVCVFTEVCQKICK